MQTVFQRVAKAFDCEIKKTNLRERSRLEPMKKYSLKHLSIKITLVMAAAAIPLFAHADTSWVHGGNWAATAGLVTNVIAYPDGLTARTTPAQATKVADIIAADYHSVDINFCPLPTQSCDGFRQLGSNPGRH